jgi:hypothetical protein
MPVLAQHDTMLNTQIKNLNNQQVVALVRAEMAEPRKAQSVREQEASQNEVKQTAEKLGARKRLHLSIVKNDAKERIVDVQSTVVLNES